MKRNWEIWAHLGAMLTVLGLGTAALGKFPDGVRSINSVDLSHIAYLMNGTNCAFAVVAQSPEYRDHLSGTEPALFTEMPYTRQMNEVLQSRLLRLGERVREAAFSEDTRVLLQTMGTTQAERPTRNELADTLDEAGHDDFADDVRGGLIHEPPASPSDDEVFTQNRRLMELLRINRIPDFLLNSGSLLVQGERWIHFEGENLLRLMGPGRNRRLHFFDDILWGVDLIQGEWDLHQVELNAHPTLEHLRLSFSVGQFFRYLRELDKFSSLELNMLSQLNDVEVGTYTRDLSRPPWPNLKRLTLDNSTGITADWFHSGFLLHHFERARLEHLDLSRIPLTQRPFPSGIRSLVLRNVLPANPGFLEEPRMWRRGYLVDEVYPVMRTMPASLQSLEWQAHGSTDQFVTHAGELLAQLPESNKLKKLVLQTDPIPVREWGTLGGLSTVWKHLDSFEYRTPADVSAEADYRRTVAAQINRALRTSHGLKTLTLATHLTGEEMLIALRGVRFNLAHANFEQTEFTEAQLIQLSEHPALKTVESLNLGGTTCRPETMEIFASPEFANLKEITFGYREGSWPVDALVNTLERFWARDISVRVQLQN